uniref:Uncharacterized protein n=1 Tax=Rhizophora mucronata TaxID=61149 RepID=A0A2P2PAQ0_RHIMU
MNQGYLPPPYKLQYYVKRLTTISEITAAILYVSGYFTFVKTNLTAMPLE